MVYIFYFLHYLGFFTFGFIFGLGVLLVRLEILDFILEK